MFSGSAAATSDKVADTGETADAVGEKLQAALSSAPAKSLPPVSFTMADVSARLAALEDSVAELKKKVFPETAKPAVTLEGILSGGKRRSRKTKTRRNHRKNRSRK